MAPKQPEHSREALFKTDTVLNPTPEQQVVLNAMRPTALIHILTPEFHGLNPADFADIRGDTVDKASAADLQPSLFWKYVPKSRRDNPEVAAFSYQSADGDFVTVALTPEEYDTGSESVEKLAQRIFTRVLKQRDEALRKASNNPFARARTDEDIRVARRGGMRAVMERQTDMEDLIEDNIMPKIHLIDRFLEMAEGRNFNLARGGRKVVSERFEELRMTIFDDMLDAVALQKKWTAEQTARAKQIIQKRLYISGSPRERVSNFREMLELARLYYGHKWALMKTKVEDANRYRRANPEVEADVYNVDEFRRHEKQNQQLQFEQTS